MSTDDFPDLLAAAFDAARQAGKREWRRMTVAVLKNRLLQVTERRFHEEQFGATNIIELVARHPELVKLDRTTKPPTVEWLGSLAAGAAESEGTAPQLQRVRADLWRAVLDYSSGREYEWDPAAGQARPVEHAEPTRKLPSVDRELLTAWRSEFAAGCRAELKVEQEARRLDEWVGAGLGTQYLPRELHRAWNAFLKARVAERLSSWFQERSLVAPDVWVTIEPTPPGPKPSELRAFVHRCVDVLTEDELRTLALPTHVLLDVAKRE